MTKKEIVKTISEEIGLTQLKTKEIVQKTFDAIVTTLVEEGRIELRNFGVFEVKKRAARKARNPRTGAKVDVDEKYVVTFKPGKEMEERVRQLEEKERQGRLASEQQNAGQPNPGQPTGESGQAPSQQPPYSSPPQSSDYQSPYSNQPNNPPNHGDYGS
ncbi:HU family DNA-binding protein [Blastopirellula marina]|uniref:Integration host factor subunit beta n=1 Tax=Blastopirellula marina TaxID=124 RepID=A0A2S8GCX9_9BACT|nr:HU family DNA-binding protein [Blastopirellula marina]PQO42322.1 integration host factor subunit beta [Blastopirellula marina]